MRCLTFADALNEKGASVTFISRKYAGNLNKLISEKKFQVVELSQPEHGKTVQNNNQQSSDDYQAWLGVTEEQDAEETIRAIGNDKSDWLIVDHYSLGKDWEKRIRPHFKNIMVIDDLANRRHDCDLLLDQNYSNNHLDRYKGLVPKATKQFLGPQYALLRPEYAKFRKTLRRRDGTVEKILIFMGGSDPENLTAMAVDALSHSGLESIFLDVVIGLNHPNSEEIHIQCHTRGRARCYNALPHLAELIVKADLCIGTGGSTSWERLCLGLPTLVITSGANQVPASEALGKDGYVEYLGPGGTLSGEDLTEKINQMVSSPVTLVRQSIAGQALVDGMGTQRVAKAII